MYDPHKEGIRWHRWRVISWIDYYEIRSRQTLPDCAVAVEQFLDNGGYAGLTIEEYLQKLGYDDVKPL